MLNRMIEGLVADGWERTGPARILIGSGWRRMGKSLFTRGGHTLEQRFPEPAPDRPCSGTKEEWRESYWVVKGPDGRWGIPLATATLPVLLTDKQGKETVMANKEYEDHMTTEERWMLHMMELEPDDHYTHTARFSISKSGLAWVRETLDTNKDIFVALRKVREERDKMRKHPFKDRLAELAQDDDTRLVFGGGGRAPLWYDARQLRKDLSEGRFDGWKEVGGELLERAEDYVARLDWRLAAHGGPWRAIVKQEDGMIIDMLVFR